MTSQQDIKEKLLEMIRNERSIHEIMELVTAWKDKEVERALMGEIMGCPYHDDWRKHRAKLESLQSQGGKND